METSDAVAVRNLFSLYFDELEIGASFTSPGRTITEADLVNFSSLTGDWYPLHTDVEWAKHSLFGERIAHGMLVLSYAMGLLPMQPGPIIAFYGMDKVRFFAPTKIGDTLHVEIELKQKEEKDDEAGLATFHMTVLNQRDEAVAKTINKVLLKRRAG